MDGHNSIPSVEKVVWDTTYACPLRCQHCYTEAGRRHARSPKVDVIRGITEKIIATGASTVALSGGEPIMFGGWRDIAQAFYRAGIDVTVFTSGYVMSDSDLEALRSWVGTVSVSLDGSTAATHDELRGRIGAWDRGRGTLTRLSARKLDCRVLGETAYRLSVDYTVVRSNFRELPAFVKEISYGTPGLDRIRVGMAIPRGLGAEPDFVEIDSPLQ